MYKRTKAVAIKPAVKKLVEDRDGGCCIFCGRPGSGNAHVVNRSQGGLGIPENLVTACWPCHSAMDNGQAGKLLRMKAEEYLKGIYPGWDKSKLVYNKWDQGL